MKRLWWVVVLVGCDRVLGLQTVADAPPTPTYTLVQQQTASTAVASDLTLTLPNEPTPGDLLVMVGAANNSLLEQVSGGASLWTLAARAEGVDLEVWFGVVDQTNTAVTIYYCPSPSNPVGPMWMSVTEWTGISSTTPLDTAVAVRSATTTTAAAGPLAVTGADLVIFATVSINPSPSTPSGEPWDALDGTSIGEFVQDEWYTTIADAAQVNGSLDVMSTCWDAVLAAFLPAAA